LSLREIAALAPLAVFVFWIGLAPEHFLTRMHTTLEAARQPAAEEVAKVWADKRTVAEVKAPNLKHQVTNNTE
jgi:NADH:ubiquinone oxidoreductase subunit 4 (subunit M)